MSQNTHLRFVRDIVLFRSYFHYNLFFLLGIRKIQAVAVPTPTWEVAEGQGPIVGIPLGSSEGCSRQDRWGCHGWVLVHGAHHSAWDSRTHHTALPAAPDALWGPGSPGSGPCVGEGGLGEGKRFQLLSQRPQWSSRNCCVSPRSCGPCPGLLLWITKGHQSAFHHLSSSFPILKSTRVMAG